MQVKKLRNQTKSQKTAREKLDKRHFWYSAEITYYRVLILRKMVPIRSLAIDKDNFVEGRKIFEKRITSFEKLQMYET